VVECDLANSLLINTFNNLDRLQGTAKYLKTHERQVSQRVLMRVLRKCAKSRSKSRTSKSHGQTGWCAKID
jgi:hypothetical protein